MGTKFVGYTCPVCDKQWVWHGFITDLSADVQEPLDFSVTKACPTCNPSTADELYRKEKIM